MAYRVVVKIEKCVWDKKTESFTSFETIKIADWCAYDKLSRAKAIYEAAGIAAETEALKS